MVETVLGILSLINFLVLTQINQKRIRLENGTFVKKYRDLMATSLWVFVFCLCIVVTKELCFIYYGNPYKIAIGSQQFALIFGGIGAFDIVRRIINDKPIESNFIIITLFYGIGITLTILLAFNGGKV